MNYQNRVYLLRTDMQNKQLDAMLISSIPNIVYLTGLSMFSDEEREAFVLITRDKLFVITDRRYKYAVLEKNYEVIELTSKYRLDVLLKKILNKFDIKKIGIEEHDLKVSEYKLISKYIQCSVNFDLKDLREIKDETEIENIKNACRLADKAFEFILNKVKFGVSELEIAFEIEYFIKKNQADVSFTPIVAFGENSAFPHHKSGERKLKIQDIVLLDFGARINNYCSDITRTIIFGKTNNKQERMYRTVLEAQNRAIEFLNSAFLIHNSYDKSVKASSVDKVARSYIASKGYPSIPHSLGHGVGIQIHELPKLSPNSKDILTNGMVFSIEPGIYIPDFGGIRIEDLILINNNKIQVLTKSTKELIEI